jgi:putative transposase
VLRTAVLCYASRVHRGFSFPLKPTPAQAEVLGQWVGVTRLVYNLAFEQRRDFWRQFQANEGRSISLASQGRELTALRAEYDWIAAAPQCGLEAALNDLDKAFEAFFRGGGYPRPRRLGENDSIRFRGREVSVQGLNAKWAKVKLPKLGWVKCRLTRALPHAAKTATVIRSGGQWRVVFACDAGEAPVALSALPSVGVDRGVANTLSLSTGEHVRLPNTERLERRRRKAQRILARRRRGSRRHAKQRARIARLHGRVARARTHHLHVASTNLARRFGVVALEALDVKAMTVRARDKGVRQKAGLNRSILAQGWSRFAAMLEYKLEAAGGRLIYVPAAFTSQTCSACGVVDARSRKSQAAFVCVHCGHEAHADTNAALEIRRRSTALLSVEGGHLRPPVEAETLAA